MYISKVDIKNFKSYLASGALELKPGFNIITGQNSAGKTALLEGLTLAFAPKPHRSATTVPVPGEAPPNTSDVRMTFVLDRTEFWHIVNGIDQYFPPPIAGFPLPGLGAYDERAVHAHQSFVNWLFEQPRFEVSVQLSKTVGGPEILSSPEPMLGLYPSEQPTPQNNARSCILVRVDQAGRPIVRGGAQTQVNNNICTYAANIIRSRIYRFSAERFNVGQCPFGSNPVLAPNAANLPEALNVLQANTNRFLELNAAVREVLPQVRHFSVRALPNEVQIIVWPHDPASIREDLAVPLNECGSGVGQVLAILYIVMTAVHPQVIIVDEPQSFLHPGAVRKLVEVLKRYPRHQYIFATHSPTVISAADPATLTICALKGVETVFKTVDPSNRKELQLYLAEIGARLSDVFGADNVLWVEGQTEEYCFPLILSQLGQRSLMGTAIVGIRQVGELEGREAKRILNIYRRLTSSNTILPLAIAFILDRECRTPDEMKELKAISQDLTKFLPRRMYENYLLHSNAIAAVANQIEGFREQPVSADEVQEKINDRHKKLEYYCKGVSGLPSEWPNAIDASRVVREIFRELSGSRVEFVKPKHSILLTEWLLGNDPEHLRELSDFLVGLFEKTC